MATATTCHEVLCGPTHVAPESPRHHRKNRTVDAVLSRDWASAVGRALKCPGEASEWMWVGLGNGSSGWLLTPLHVACALHPPAAAVEALVEADPDAVSLPDAHGRLPLHMACAHGAPTEAVKVLLRHHPHGAGRADGEGRTPLHLACSSAEVESQAGSSSDPDEVSRLLLWFCPLAAREPDQRGRLPLALACEAGASPDFLSALWRAFPGSASAVDDESRTALHYYVGRRRRFDENTTEWIRRLADGLSVKENEYGFLPLHVACADGDAATATAVLKERPGAAAVPDRRGSYPLHLACRRNGDGDLAEDTYNLVLALVEAHPDAVRCEDSDGRLPLHWAVRANLISCTTTFENLSEEGHSPSSRTDLMHLLLQRHTAGAEKAESKYGYLPLHVACLHGASAKAVNLLIEAYPDAVGKTDALGRTPADLYRHFLEHRHSFLGRISQSLRSEAEVANVMEMLTIET